MLRQKTIPLCLVGHVDHGKTTLAKVLTGIDLDTHKEEKRRKLTINPGLCSLNTEKSAYSLIDLPGHQNFLKQMVMGSFAAEIAILVLAFDDGIMPQTITHLNILHNNGIKHLLLVFTKSDKASLIRKDEVRKKTSKLLENYSFTVVTKEVSLFSDDAKEIILSGLNEITDKYYASSFFSFHHKSPFTRFAIDRVFHKKGQGVVATGIILGKDASQETFFYLPNEKKPLKIRQFEQHGKERTFLKGGERYALNFQSAELEVLKRKKILISHPFSPPCEYLLEIKNTFKETKKIFEGIINCGPQETHFKGKMLTEKIAKIIPTNETLFLVGDPFIMRTSDKKNLIGLGHIIDHAPLHFQKVSDKISTYLEHLSSPHLSERINAHVFKIHDLLSHQDLEHYLNEIFPQEKPFYFSSHFLQHLELKIITLLNKHNQPLELNKILPHLLQKDFSSTELLQLIPSLKNSCQFYIDCHGLCYLKAHLLKKENKLHLPLSSLRSLIKKNETKVILPLHYQGHIQKPYKISQQDYLTLFTLLEWKGELFSINQQYILTTTKNDITRKLKGFFQKSPDKGITIAEFRDLIVGNRKICLLMMEHFDNQGLTVRKGDYRFLRESFQNSPS